MMSLGLVVSMYLSMFYLFVITSLLVCIKINVQAHVRKKVSIDFFAIQKVSQALQITRVSYSQISYHVSKILAPHVTNEYR